jgi:hypothetical protein
MTIQAAQQIVWFRRLDRLFWLAWLGLVVMVWVGYWMNADQRALFIQSSPDQAQCAALMPDPASMSAIGRTMYWGLFWMEISIYLILLGALHLIVHRFARGRIFVSETLATMRWLGLVLIVWPFLDAAASQFVFASLKSRGDLLVYTPGYVVDVAPIAVGLFLVALRYVLDCAIEIKSENDLTI